MKKLALIAIVLTTLGFNSVIPALSAQSVRAYSIANPIQHTDHLPTIAGDSIQQPVYLAQAAAVSDTRLQSAQTILNRLLTANQVPAEIAPKLEIQDSSQLNAATDGQKILITSTLWEKLKTNDQRAFVISHEVAHILLNHIGKTQARRIGLSLLDSLFVRRYTQEGSLAQLASELGIGLVDKRSSRGYEYQADDLGVKLMTQAGYNPQSAIEVFGILQAATPGNRTPEFLQSHPISESRIRALVQKYKLSTN